LGYGHKAYNCLNKKVMVIKNGEIQSNHSSSSSASSLSSFSPSSPTNSTSSDSDFDQQPKKGDLLVIRQVLGHVHKENWWF